MRRLALKFGPTGRNASHLAEHSPNQNAPLDAFGGRGVALGRSHALATETSAKKSGELTLTQKAAGSCLLQVQRCHRLLPQMSSSSLARRSRCAKVRTFACARVTAPTRSCCYAGLSA